MDALLRRHYMMTRLRPASQQVISYRATPSGTGAASIAKIKGRTDAVNQLVKNGHFESVSEWQTNNLTYSVSGGTASVTPSEANSSLQQPFAVISGHKYLLYAEVNMTTPSTKIELNLRDGYGAKKAANTAAVSGWQVLTGIITAAADNASGYTRLYYADESASYQARNYFIVDLTLMYGSGKEPATVAAFLAEYPEALTAPYNAGKLINNKVTALVTDGFNQLDLRLAENGVINSTTGAKVDSTGAVRVRVKILPNTQYDIWTASGVRLDSSPVHYYSADDTYLGPQLIVSYLSSGDHVTTTFNGAAYMYVVFRGIGVTLDKDVIQNYEININLSHSGIRNGEYEPYWKSTLNIVHSQIYGKLEGEGEMVQIAPNGFRGVGGNYDEVDVVKKEAYIRRAWVDMGTLNWTYESGSGLMYAPIANIVDPGYPRRVPLACAKYTGIYDGRTLENTPDKSIFNRTTANLGVMVKDSAYTDAAAFKIAMDGVMLDYQLATPLHYTDLMYSEDGGQTFTEIPSNYRVDDFGTERRLPDGIVDGAPASTPLVADIRYPW